MNITQHGTAQRLTPKMSTFGQLEREPFRELTYDIYNKLVVNMKWEISTERLIKYAQKPITHA